MVVGVGSSELEDEPDAPQLETTRTTTNTASTRQFFRINSAKYLFYFQIVDAYVKEVRNRIAELGSSTG